MVVGLLVVLGGCGRKRVVVVPNTPDGLACQRECMTVFYTCQGGRGRNAKVCAAGQQECLATCPGAIYSDGTPAVGYGAAPAPTLVSTPAPVEPAPVAPAAPSTAKCVASELPEWAGASAARKKELMAECRGE